MEQAKYCMLTLSSFCIAEQEKHNKFWIMLTFYYLWKSQRFPYLTHQPTQKNAVAHTFNQKKKYVYAASNSILFFTWKKLYVKVLYAVFKVSKFNCRKFIEKWNRRRRHSFFLITWVKEEDEKIPSKIVTYLLVFFKWENVIRRWCVYLTKIKKILYI